MKILGIVATLGLVAALAFGALGTGAWFSATGSSANSQVEAGTLTIELADNDESWGAGVSATWVSGPLAPGGPGFESTLYVKNTGTVDAPFLALDFKTSGGYNEALMDQIEVYKFVELVNGAWVDSLATPQSYGSLVGDKNGLLTLDEFIKSYHSGEPSWAEGRVPDEFGGWVGSKWDSISGGGYDVSPGPALAAGAEYRLVIGLRLMETADDTLQGATCEFDILVKAMQDTSQAK